MKEFDRLKYLKKCRILPVEPMPLSRACRKFVVIPACDELEYIGRSLSSLPLTGGETVVVVVNHPADADARVRAASETLRETLPAHIHRIYAPDLAGGVGEARKLGMDAVLAAGAAADSLIFSLDADTVVEPDYFTAAEAAFAADPAISALSIGFAHLPGDTPEEERAIRRYEAYLDRYVRKLGEAGSPYAFQTVGSAFAVRLDAYLKAGGMRVRKGGEDFYFLQAVAKTGKVGVLDNVLLHPSARPSQRVPFGTGPAVKKLVGGEELDEISDGAFAALKNILDCAPELPPGLDFFRREGFYEAWPKILANTPETPAARLRAFHGWFDGLKTLRFLHDFDRK